MTIPQDQARRMAEELLGDGDLNSLMSEAPYITEYPATCREFAYKAIAAALVKLTQEQEPAAIIKSWVSGSYGRKYKIEVLREDLDAGDALYTHPITSQQEERVRELERLLDVVREAMVNNGIQININSRDYFEAISAIDAALAAEPVKDGWKLLKDSTQEERSWPEDYAHENGSYYCLCCHCGRQFQGHKRRVVCKVCDASPSPALAVPDGYVSVIDVEKLLCEKLGIQWSATGISIVSLIDRLAGVPDAAKPEHPLTKQVRDAKAYLAKLPDGGASIQLQGNDHYAAKPKMQGERAELIEYLKTAAVNSAGIYYTDHPFYRAAALLSAGPARVEPLSDKQIEAGRGEVFSINNPFCPCDSKTFRKAVQWAERKHGIGKDQAS